MNSHQKRTAEEVKKKWANLKSAAKEGAIKKKKDIKGTGGGPACVPSLTNRQEKIVAILGEELLYGIEGGFDSDISIAPIRESTLILNGLQENGCYSPLAATDSQSQLFQDVESPREPSMIVDGLASDCESPEFMQTVEEASMAQTSKQAGKSSKTVITPVRVPKKPKKSRQLTGTPNGDVLQRQRIRESRIQLSNELLKSNDVISAALQNISNHLEVTVQSQDKMLAIQRKRLALERKKLKAEAENRSMLLQILSKLESK